VTLDVRVDDGAGLAWDHPARIIAAPGHTPGSVTACFGHGAPLVGDAGGRLRQVAAAL
jgi:hypothetical protein